jgi:magnesium chelatase family protein
MEEGRVTIARASFTLQYPARFTVVAAMNPCPCGYFGEGTRTCRCASNEIHRYRNRVSGPLLDRIDIQVDIPPVPYGDLRASKKEESSAAVLSRVTVARRRQGERFGTSAHVNGVMTPRQVRRHCMIDGAGESVLRGAFDRLALSARAVTRVLKVSRTIADLDGREKIAAEDVAEAVGCRSLDGSPFFS